MPAKDTDWEITARQHNLRVSYELMLTPMLQGVLASQQHHAQVLNQYAQWIDQGQLV